MLRFTRHRDGDVVLLVHGLTTSTDMFVMPEHRNLVSYLLDEGFEVWSFDARFSNRHSYNLAYHRYTFDDCALFDFPPAVELVRNHIDVGDGMARALQAPEPPTSGPTGARATSSGRPACITTATS